MQAYNVSYFKHADLFYVQVGGKYGIAYKVDAFARLMMNRPNVAFLVDGKQMALGEILCHFWCIEPKTWLDSKAAQANYEYRQSRRNFINNVKTILNIKE